MQILYRVSIRTFTTVILAILFTAAMEGQAIDHWETMVETGQDVKYIAPVSEVAVDWISPGFDDSGWTDGVSGIGYGDNDDNTIISNAYSVYVRYRFTIADPAVIDSLILDMDFDDGFVAYLNGQEIARDNMGEAYSSTSWNQSSDGIIEELPMGSYRYFLERDAVSLLVTGENFLCVEVHNQDLSSSDLSSNTFLSAGITNSNTYFNEPPIWFYGPEVMPSQLPVMVISTNGQTILKDSAIVVDMGLVFNGPGVDNFPNDSFNEYDGKMRIKIRGSTSSNFPKRPYTVELQTDSGTNNNVSILGLPRENDFVLNGPYSDKSLLRNVIAFDLYRAMGHWAPRIRLIDLYQDDNYRGIYVLMEKIKIDKYRVDIKQLTPADVSETDITGGYILQVDRTNKLESNEFWTSPVSFEGSARNTFEYFDPNRDELTTAQAEYVKNYVNHFDAVLASTYYKNPISGFKPLIDVESFADYFILQEFLKDVDAYRLSTFFYKASDLEGGKLHAGPPWDYNLTLGNTNYGNETWETYKWEYRVSGKYWWKRMMYDEVYKNEVLCRWDLLHEQVLNETFIHNMIDGYLSQMGNSIDRNFERWSILGVYVWPNYFIGNTYAEEISFLKNWISERIEWMDSQWGGKCVTGTYGDIIQPLTSLVISPNPSDLSHIRIQVPDHQAGDYRLSVYDLNGREVYSSRYVLDHYSGNIFLEDISFLDQGIYLLRLSGEGKIYSGKLMRE